MELPGILYDLTGSEKSKMVASKTGNTSISAWRAYRNAIPTAVTVFSRSSNPMGLSVLLWDLTRSMKIKMASFKQEVPIYQLVNMGHVDVMVSPPKKNVTWPWHDGFNSCRGLPYHSSPRSNLGQAVYAHCLGGGEPSYTSTCSSVFIYCKTNAVCRWFPMQQMFLMCYLTTNEQNSNGYPMFPGSSNTGRQVAILSDV